MTNLQIPCPACGALFDLEQALDSADGKRFVDLLCTLPPTAIRPVYNYLKLFKPQKQVLSWARAYKLLQELAPMIRDAQISRNGTRYVIPRAHWEQALTDLVLNRPATLALPLKSHGYLLSILAGQADKQAAIQEDKIEQQRRNRGGNGAATGFKAVAETVPPPPNPQNNPPSKPPANWRPESLSKKTGDNHD